MTLYNMGILLVNKFFIKIMLKLYLLEAYFFHALVKSALCKA